MAEFESGGGFFAGNREVGDLKFALLLAVRFVILIFNCSAGGSLVPLQDGTGEYQSCSAHQQPPQFLPLEEKKKDRKLES